MVRISRCFLLLLVVPYCSTATFAQSDRYSVINLGTLPGGSAMVRGINNSGLVVGRSGTEFNTETRGFVWKSQDQMQALASFPDVDFSEATSINSAGSIAGTSGLAHGAHRAVLWENAANVRALGALPGDTASESYAINDSGQVVGASSGPSGTHAWIWTDSGGMHSLGSL